MRYLLTLLCMAISAIACAQNAIAIHQKNGQVAKFAFADKPEITYAGNDLLMTTSKTSVRYAMADLQKLTFDGSFTVDVEEVKADVLFSFESNGIRINGEKPGTPFYVFDMKGSKVYQGVIDAEGRADIRMSQLPAGIYVVKTQSTSFKVKK
ncbi:MAG: T9SS type A sorting domain-containing protein [Bacteroidaceae bacterium]|nr:T9SS type A sorting domain-containing protein [Bacteroidaceae bacterium]